MIERIRVGVAGLGGWGRNVLRSFADEPAFSLKWICDQDPVRLAESHARYRAPLATGRFEELLEDPAIDAVAIATPAPVHFSMAWNALRAGKHVFVEKPMTLCSEEAEKLVGLAERTGLKLMAGHLLEYHPAVEEMKRQIASGTIGELLFMYNRRLNLGVVRSTENAWWSLAPHDISVICFIFDEAPGRITSNGICALQPGIEDTAWATLHFPSGRAANIHVSWLDVHKERKMVVVGSRGMLVFDDMATTDKLCFHDKWARHHQGIGSVSVHSGAGKPVPISNETPLPREIRHFAEAIRNDKPLRSDGRDGLRVVRILEQANRQISMCRAAVGVVRVRDKSGELVIHD